MSGTGEKQVEQLTLTACVRLGEHMLQVIAKRTLRDVEFRRDPGCVMPCHEQVCDRSLSGRQSKSAARSAGFASGDTSGSLIRDQELRGPSGGAWSIGRQDCDRERPLSGPADAEADSRGAAFALNSGEGGSAGPSGEARSERRLAHPQLQGYCHFRELRVLNNSPSAHAHLKLQRQVRAVTS